MAVYTEIDDEELDRLLAQYDIGAAVSCKGIAEGVENSNFLLQTEKGSYILTLYEKRVHEEDLPFFLNLLDHLAAAGFPCPTPIHGRDGRALRRAAGRPAAITSFLTGRSLRRPAPVHCGELGAALAELHIRAGDFAMRRENSLGLASWRPLLDSCAGQADSLKPGLNAFLQEEMDFLEEHWPRELPSGIIHADMFPDNVFFLRDRLCGVIDFYFACNDFLLYDLAICLNAWCFETDNAFNITKARKLIRHYDRRRRLDDEEIAALPVLARGSAMRFLLTRLYDWLNRIEGALVQPKDPLEYYQRLLFHRNAASARAYGWGD